MPKWARIEDGVVREVVDADPAGRFHPSLIFAPAPDDVREGQLYGDGAFRDPPPPPSPPPPTYRELRKAAYIAELGKSEQPNFIDTVGDVLDDLIREIRARGEPVTPEAAALFAKVDAIKARFPRE